MKTSGNNTRMFRRNSLAFIAGTAGTLGVTTSFANSSFGNELQNGRGDGNVRSFEAKGNGRTDDSAAVQAAVDAGSGSVFFPKGVYRVTKTIEVHLNRIGFTSVRSDGSSQIITAGISPAFRIIGTHSKSAAGLILRRVTDSIVSGCIIRNDTGTSGFEAIVFFRKPVNAPLTS